LCLMRERNFSFSMALAGTGKQTKSVQHELDKKRLIVERQTKKIRNQIKHNFY
jgi:hypothetical protein